MGNNAVAQNNTSNIEDLKLNLDSEIHYHLQDSLKEYQSEFDWFFSNLFIFYKRFISSQDASSCSFTPTCSEYALQAIKRQGIILGVFNFWDRFSRCNGMSPEDYPLDRDLKLLIDPVRNSRYEKK